MSDEGFCALSTDRELFRETTELTREAGSHYENSLFVTERGRIGMNVGGLVFVRSIAEWHKDAAERDSLASQLYQYRAAIEADIAQLDIKADEAEYQDVRKMCQDKAQALTVALSRLDEITEKKEADDVRH